MDRNTAYFILNLLPGIGPITVKKLLHDDLLTPEDLLTASPQQLKAAGATNRHCELLGAWKGLDWQSELHACEDTGVQIITPASSLYPPSLKAIYDPPLALYVRGQVNLLSKPNALAVVGSRRVTSYGRTMCERLVRGAVVHHWQVVSGLARGIDATAHQTTLNSGGITLAVLGSGLGRIYPQEHLPMAFEIAQTGAVISEFPLQYPPDKRTFPMRNRIISGLCQATLVIEAGKRSGSLITAEQALEQGRPVFAVPGAVTNPQSAGCHQLIKMGATLTESIDDILAEFPCQPELFSSEEKVKTRQSASEKNLNSLEKELVSIMEREQMPLTVDQLASASELEIAEIMRTLMVLEIRKLVRQLPGMKYTVDEGQIY